MPPTHTVLPGLLRFDGRLAVTGDVTIEGRSDGRIESDGCVTIASAATCRAVIRARMCVIFGEVIGDVACSEAIEVAAGARVVGDLRAPDVAVDADAEIEGRVDLLAPGPELAQRRRIGVRVRGRALTRPAPPPRLTGDSLDFDNNPTLIR